MNICICIYFMSCLRHELCVTRFERVCGIAYFVFLSKFRFEYNTYHSRLSHVWNCTDLEESNTTDGGCPGNKIDGIEGSVEGESVREIVGDTGGDPPNVKGDDVEPDDGVAVEDVVDGGVAVEDDVDRRVDMYCKDVDAMECIDCLNSFTFGRISL